MLSGPFVSTLRRSLFWAGSTAVLASVACSAVGCSASVDDATDGSSDEGALSIRDRSTGPGEAQNTSFIPAASTAFQRGRPGLVRAIVIHDTEGSMSSAVNTFAKAGNESSAHYVVDKDGNAVQMVRERDIANHAYHSIYNAYAIGVEHEGFQSQTYPQAQYQGSAKLVAELVKRYRVPIDRQHIIGHYQVPKEDSQTVPCAENATNCGGHGGHTDPGRNWDWNGYMAQVTQAARAIGYDTSQAIPDSAYPFQVVNPLEALELRTPSGGRANLVGGFWATQCSASDATTSTSFRTIIDSSGPSRAETRYDTPSSGSCGDLRDGAFPIIFNGYKLDEMNSICIRRGNTFYRVEKSDGACLSARPECLDASCAAQGDDCVRSVAYPIAAGSSECR